MITLTSSSTAAIRHPTMGAIDPIYAKEQANNKIKSVIMKGKNQLQHSNSNILPSKVECTNREPITRVISANTLNIDTRLEDGLQSLNLLDTTTSEPQSPFAKQVSRKSSDQAKVRNNSSFHLKAKRFLNISSNGLKSSASTSCLNLASAGASPIASDSEAPVASPTRASLTHEWKKLKTPNKCRECNLIVYFNGRECSFCGFIAHKKCVTVLVIKCSGQALSSASDPFHAHQHQHHRKQQTHRCLSSAGQQQQFSDNNNEPPRLDYLTHKSHQKEQPQQQQPRKQDQQQLSPKKTKNSIQPIFGQPVDTESRQVVDFLRRFVYEIDTRGLTSKGIYRVSSIKSKVDRLCTYYDQNLSSLVDLSSFHPNIIANALKMYLRQLPEPLLTLKLYNKFIDIGKKYANSSSSSSASNSDAEQQPSRYPFKPKKTYSFSTTVQDNSAPAYMDPNYNPLLVVELREIIDLLPPVNRELVAVLMRHLKRVADMSSENQMSAKNLSIIFGPTLMSDNNKSLAIVDNIHQARVVELMITWANQIFPQYNNYESRMCIDLDVPPPSPPPPEVFYRGLSPQRQPIDSFMMATDTPQPTLLITSDSPPENTVVQGCVNSYELKLKPQTATTRKDLQELRKQFFNESQPATIRPSTSEISRQQSSPIVGSPTNQLDQRRDTITTSNTPVLPTIKIQPYSYPNHNTPGGKSK